MLRKVQTFIMHHFFSRALCALILAKLLPCPLLARGSLDPPPGPPAESMKSLEQVEPRTPIGSIPFEITRRGSYYLTGDLVLSDETDSIHGIRISASEVTLDLGGFTLTGGSGIGIYLTAEEGQRNITIRNGLIRDWGQGGIIGNEGTGAGNGPLTEDSFRTGLILSDLTVADCGGPGIGLGGNCVVRECLIYNVQGYGLRMAQGARVRNSRIYNINGPGLICGEGATLQGLVISNCTLPEVGDGALQASASTIRDCAVFRSNGTGFELVRCTVSGSQAAENSGAGFHTQASALINCVAEENSAQGFLGTDSTFAHCTSNANNTGFDLTGGTATACNASNNTTTGFKLDRALATQCLSRENDAHGAVLQRSTLRDCQINGNAGDGLLARDQNTVTGCALRDNGGNTGTTAAIRVLGNHNRLDANTLTRMTADQDYGILIITETTGDDPPVTTGIQNLITRNTATGFPTNYSGDKQQNFFPIATSTADTNNPLTNLDTDALLPLP
jgi:hypothetical protein